MWRDVGRSIFALGSLRMHHNEYYYYYYCYYENRIPADYKICVLCMYTCMYTSMHTCMHLCMHVPLVVVWARLYALEWTWEPKLPPPALNPTTEPPVWNSLKAPLGRFLCTAPERMSYRGRDSGGGWGNSGSQSSKQSDPNPNNNIFDKKAMLQMYNETHDVWVSPFLWRDYT